jgi:hypothetical protein
MLKKSIEETVNKCEHALFIFDEMDKIPVQLMDVIKPFVDLIQQQASAKYRHSVFMFLSNSGAEVIANKAFDLYLDQVDRNFFQLKMFHQILENHIFNNKKEDQNGFWHLSLIKHHLIDHYIPFIPLEREHVKMCIFIEFKKNSIDEKNRVTIYKDVDHISDELTYEPAGFNIFSTNGCKRIPQLVRKLIVDLREL